MVIARSRASTGFTIVELLVVIIIIAVLATISAVAYRGIQDRARDSALQADLSQAAKQLTVDSMANKGSFPNSTASANDGKGLTASSGTSYQYTVNNLVSPPTYCLSGINGSRGFHITESGIPSTGVCAGHTAPGAGGGTVVSCSSVTVGGAGQAGGNIFYKDTSKNPVVCYEAAPVGWYPATAPIDPQAEWGCYNIAVSGADGTAIGAGKQNTIDMLAANCSPFTAGRSLAATIAAAYTGGGKSDWYLPSINELSQVYAQSSAVGGLAASHYWSSSETSSAVAWVLYIPNGNQLNIYAKNTQKYVRPIRSFSD